MKKYLRKIDVFTIVIFGISMVVSTFSLGGELSDGEAINKAGRQRMLSQRITKAYLQIASEVSYLRSKKQLDQGLALFEEQLLELQDNAPSQKIGRKLDAVETLWNDFRKLAIMPPSKSDAIELIKKSDVLLSACHKIVLLWEEGTNNNANKMVNIAGRQRMLSQRIGKFYAAHYFGIETDDIVVGLNQALIEYEDGLNVLISSEYNTNSINRALKKVSNQWEYSKQGLSQMNRGNHVPHVISVTTESMLKRMNKITGMYSDLSSQVQFGKADRNANSKINIPGLASVVSP
jgi:nitrate/nitrite-specific signal transduction histidine kinase